MVSYFNSLDFKSALTIIPRFLLWNYDIFLSVAEPSKVLLEISGSEHGYEESHECKYFNTEIIDLESLKWYKTYI
jgi:hypothetical protein